MYTIRLEANNTKVVLSSTVEVIVDKGVSLANNLDVFYLRQLLKTIEFK